MLITLAAKIFSGSHTKESHARMRNKTDNPLPETTQAPPASPEPASPAPPTFHPRDWAPLQDAVLQLISLVGGKRDLGLVMINRYLRSGQLAGALVAPDGTLTLFSRTDWERRTVHAPLNPAEGVRVEPYEAGYYFVRRAGLAELTSPATPATPADRQLHAAGASEPAAPAEESMPEPAPAVEPEPAPPSPQVEPTPPAEPKQPALAEKRTTPRGPKPGTVKRYAPADRELFDEVVRLMSEGLSLTAATQRLAEDGRVAGVGTPISRARRLASLFIAERNSLLLALTRSH